MADGVVAPSEWYRADDRSPYPVMSDHGSFDFPSKQSVATPSDVVHKSFEVSRGGAITADGYGLGARGTAVGCRNVAKAQLDLLPFIARNELSLLVSGLKNMAFASSIAAQAGPALEVGRLAFNAVS